MAAFNLSASTLRQVKLFLDSIANAFKSVLVRINIRHDDKMRSLNALIGLELGSKNIIFDHYQDQVLGNKLLFEEDCSKIIQASEKNGNIAQRLEPLYFLTSIYCILILLTYGINKFCFSSSGECQLFLILQVVFIILSIIPILISDTEFKKRHFVFSYIFIFTNNYNTI
ncbi:MAG: hypothetical protein IPP42_17490 [Saprospiraceae bacterium]|nr:hypothetical protein [Saprospiraceae bacterium]